MDESSLAMFAAGAVAGSEAKNARIAELEAKVREWEVWSTGIQCDFAGLERNDELHDWDWIDQHRPMPKRMDQT